MEGMEYIGVAAHSGITGGGLAYMGIDHYPYWNMPQSDHVLRRHMQLANCNVVFSMLDTWSLPTDFNGEKTFKWIPYTPIDAGPLSLENFVYLNRAHKILVNSKWGQEQCNEWELPTTYVPHVVPTDTYKPISDKGLCRMPLGYSPDHFLVGMVGANKGRMMVSRKGFEYAIRAFAEFSHNHDDARMYIHGAIRNIDRDSIDLLRTAQMYGVDDKVVGLDAYTATIGVSEEALAMIYNAFDVLMAPSLAESCNVPLIEAQACGTPIIGNRTSGQTEHINSGWITEPSSRLLTPQCTYWDIPDWEAMAQSLEDAYTALGTRDGRKKYAKKARKFAMDFDVKKVTKKYWAPIIKELADEEEADQIKAKELENIEDEDRTQELPVAIGAPEGTKF